VKPRAFTRKTHAENERTHKAEVRVHFSPHEKSKGKNMFHPLVIATKDGIKRDFTSERKSDWSKLKKLLKSHRITPDGYHYKKPGQKRRKRVTRSDITELELKRLQTEQIRRSLHS